MPAEEGHPYAEEADMERSDSPADTLETSEPAQKSVAAQRWKMLFQRLKVMKFTGRSRPTFSIDHLEGLKALFEDKDRRLIELKMADWIRIFTSHFGAKYSRRQLMRWFEDVDVDASGEVSWDEFTGYMIQEATVTTTEHARARQYLPIHTTAQPAVEHKEVAKHLVVSDRHRLIFTAGYDGYIKTWNLDTMECCRSVNNTRNSIAFTESSSAAGISAGVSPVTDVVLGSKGTVLYVCSADKSVHLYEPTRLTLLRRYIGRNKYNELDVTSRFVGNSKSPVDTVLLMQMGEVMRTMDVCTVNGKEMLFFGFIDGTVSAYPAMRNSRAVELHPSLVVKVHRGTIAKLRYVPAFDAVLTCAWDRSLTLLNPRTGAAMMNFRGGENTEGHTKAAFDFAINRRTRTIASIASERDICLWNLSSDTPLQRLKSHTSQLISVAFNEADNQLVSLSADNCLKVWDMRTFHLFQSISHNDRHTRLAAIGYSHDRSQIIGLSQSVYGWAMRRFAAGFNNKFCGHIEPVTNLLIADEGNVLITGDSCTAMAWDVTTGQRSIVWEAAGEEDPMTAIGLDVHQRRLLCATKSLRMMSFNFRNAQLLRDIQLTVSAPPIAVLHACNKEESSRNTVIVTPKDVVIVQHTSDPTSTQYNTRRSHAKHASIVSCALTQTTGRVTLPSLICGLADGTLQIISISSAEVISTAAHPDDAAKSARSRANKTKEELLMDEVMGNSGGSATRSVEDMVLLPQRNFLVTVVGTGCIYFWDIARTNTVRYAHFTNIQPAEHLVKVAVNTSEHLLATGDDLGIVYVRDIRRLPKNLGNVSFNRRQIPLVSTFKAHSGQITALRFINIKMIVTSGSDMLVKLFHMDGRFVGCFGQPDPWWLYNVRSWGSTEEYMSDITEPKPTEKSRLTTPLTDEGGGNDGFFLTSTGAGSAHGNLAEYMTRPPIPRLLPESDDDEAMFASFMKGRSRLDPLPSSNSKLAGVAIGAPRALSRGMSREKSREGILKLGYRVPIVPKNEARDSPESSARASTALSFFSKKKMATADDDPFPRPRSGQTSPRDEAPPRSGRQHFSNTMPLSTANEFGAKATPRKGPLNSPRLSPKRTPMYGTPSKLHDLFSTSTQDFALAKKSREEHRLEKESSFTLGDVLSKRSDAHHRISSAMSEDPRFWTTRASTTLPLTPVEFPTRPKQKPRVQLQTLRKVRNPGGAPQTAPKK